MSDHPFDPAALQHVVAKTLAESPEIPPGARGGFLTVANRDGVRAVLAVKVNDYWTVHAAVETPWANPKDVQFGVTISGTW